MVCTDFSSSAEIAFIADWESVYYHAAQYIKNDPVLKFYPYYRDGRKSSFTEMDNNDVLLLPMEVSSAPLEYVDVTGETLQLELAAGFVGITEDSVTLSLRPQIVWYISKEDCDKY